MAIEITRPGKDSLLLNSPVMPAAGTLGYGDSYRDLINFSKLGAFVTNPVTLNARHPATGTRVVPLDAGVLVHTGLPNPGLNKTINRFRGLWKQMGVPVVVHLVATTLDEIERAASRLDEEDAVAAVELGLNDDISWREAEAYIGAAVERTDKPVLARLPMQDAYTLAEAVTDAGAGAIVIAAPPRGTARDPLSGRLIGGRIYGPLVKPLILRMVGVLARRAQIPLIGAGGIHTPQDGRDYLDAGAKAVQVDAVTWTHPRMLEIIARDLGGQVITRPMDALPDEWHPGMGETEREAKRRAEEAQSKARSDDGD